jgi:hypothetical protein
MFAIFVSYFFYFAVLSITVPGLSQVLSYQVDGLQKKYSSTLTLHPLITLELQH